MIKTFFLLLLTLSCFTVKAQSPSYSSAFIREYPLLSLDDSYRSGFLLIDDNFYLLNHATLHLQVCKISRSAPGAIESRKTIKTNISALEGIGNFPYCGNCVDFFSFGEKAFLNINYLYANLHDCNREPLGCNYYYTGVIKPDADSIIFRKSDLPERDKYFHKHILIEKILPFKDSLSALFIKETAFGKLQYVEVRFEERDYGLEAIAVREVKDNFPYKIVGVFDTLDTFLSYENKNHDLGHKLSLWDGKNYQRSSVLDYLKEKKEFISQAAHNPEKGFLVFASTTGRYVTFFPTEKFGLRCEAVSAVSGRPVKAEFLIRKASDSLSVWDSTGYSVEKLLEPKQNYEIFVYAEGYYYASGKINGDSVKGGDIITRTFVLDSVAASGSSKNPEKERRFENIYFEVGSAKLRGESLKELEYLVRFLRDNPERKIRISGYTDNKSSASFNLKLSKARAENVRKTLIKMGLSPERIIEVKGFGESHPVSDNNTAAGRARNRRVTYTIITH